MAGGSAYIEIAYPVMTSTPYKEIKINDFQTLRNFSFLNYSNNNSKNNQWSYFLKNFTIHNICGLLANIILFVQYEQLQTFSRSNSRDNDIELSMHEHGLRKIDRDFYLLSLQNKTSMDIVCTWIWRVVLNHSE